MSDTQAVRDVRRYRILEILAMGDRATEAEKQEGAVLWHEHIKDIRAYIEEQFPTTEEHRQSRSKHRGEFPAER